MKEITLSVEDLLSNLGGVENIKIMMAVVLELLLV